MNRIPLAALCLLALVSRKSVTPVAATSEAQTPAPATATAGPVTAGVSWITVRDPREQGFSIDVPKGWKTYGGLFRFSNTDVRMLVDSTSPDQAVNLRIGDSMVPPYQVPGPFVRPGPGVAAYASGQVFSTKYGQARFSSLCTGVKVTKSDAVPPKYHSPGSGLIHVTGGEAYFTCTRNGAPMSAYVYSETQLVGNGAPPSNWTVVALASVLAPTAQGTASGALLAKMGGSLAMNPQWTAMQQNLDNQAIAQLNANTAATIQRTQAENQREQGIMAASDAQEQNFDDVINGVAYTVNPATGQTQTVPLGNGAASWVDGGTMVQSAMSPGAGFTQLQTISR